MLLEIASRGKHRLSPEDWVILTVIFLLAVEKPPDPGFQYLHVYNRKTIFILQDCSEK